MIGNKNRKGANYYAKRLAVTESARAQILAQRLSFEEMNIKEYIWISERDSKTCDSCKANDGKIFKVKDLKVFDNAPPLHPWCRCSVARNVDLEERIYTKERRVTKVKIKI